jgi:hypothetical protein
VDLRFSKSIRLGGTQRLRGNVDVYNVLNANNVLNMNTQYGATWRNVTQILSGRLFRLGVQFDY